MIHLQHIKYQDSRAKCNGPLSIAPPFLFLIVAPEDYVKVVTCVPTEYIFCQAFEINTGSKEKRYYFFVLPVVKRMEIS